jgi:thiamine-phosphate pyrophosphorylase
LGRDAQIGVTCHASRHFAMEAGDAGADYVAFGAFFPSTPNPASGGRASPFWSGGADCSNSLRGDRRHNARQCAPLVAAGADFLAVSGSVWNGDEAASIKAFASAIARAMQDKISR